MNSIIYSITLLILLASNANASLIEVLYSGNITSIRQATCTDLDTSGFSPRCRDWDSEYLSTSTFYNDSVIGLGGLFEGKSVIDSDQAFVLSSDGYQASYLSATLSTELNVGGILFPNFNEPYSSIGGSVSVVNGRRDRDLFNISKWFSGSDYFASFDLYLHDRDGIAFSGFEIPEVLDISMFEVRNLGIAFVHRPSGNQLHVDANIKAITYLLKPLNVSEPTSFSLLFLGMFLILLTAQRRHPFLKSSKTKGMF